MVEITVIVAVYQAEKFIRRCLDSLKKQTFRNFEVLLIDDGSIDESGRICDEYAENDERFFVIHKKNGGVSSARQTGLDYARGEFVIHADPDDWVEPTMLEDLITNARENHSDIVICDFFLETKNKTSYIVQKPTSLDHEQFFSDLMGSLHGCCWNKLVKREKFLKHNISFPKEMVMCEDSFVNLRLAQNPIKISYLPKALYHYDRIVNENSAVNSCTEKKLKSQMFLIDWFQGVLKNPDLLVERKKQAKYTALMLESVPQENFRKLYQEINHLFSLKFCNIGRMDFFVFIALRFSVSFARFLLKLKAKIKTF